VKIGGLYDRLVSARGKIGGIVEKNAGNRLRRKVNGKE
jgi:hypothetical protein